MLDCIIIGNGLAGISAALTLQANQKEFILFGSGKLSEKIEKAERILNYPGLVKITGKDFTKALQEQIAEQNIPLKEEKVSLVYALKDKFGVATNEGGYYESKSVILACGVENIKQIKGENEFLGKGVSYCATCDGFLYKGKTIAVFCTSKRLEHEITMLSKIAGKVYAIPMYQNVALDGDNIKIIKRVPKAILGDKRVAKLDFGVEVENGEKEIEIDGIFVLRESVFPATLLNGLELTEDNHVAVNRNMETNIKGCFAAGDCTGRPYQYTKAAGEGNVAAHAVVAYIKEK